MRQSALAVARMRVLYQEESKVGVEGSRLDRSAAARTALARGNPSLSSLFSPDPALTGGLAASDAQVEAL